VGLEGYGLNIVEHRHIDDGTTGEGTAGE